MIEAGTASPIHFDQGDPLAVIRQGTGNSRARLSCSDHDCVIGSHAGSAFLVGDSIAPNAIAVTSGARGEVAAPVPDPLDSYGTVTTQRARYAPVVLLRLDLDQIPARYRPRDEKILSKPVLRVERSWRI
jgi:hypothetical protein